MERRCTGHCCKGFALEYSYSEIQSDYQTWLQNSQGPGGDKKSKIPQVEIIAPMLIPLGGSPKYKEFTYTCKNLDPSGDCRIYQDRPQMCRDFPEPGVGCHFWNCTSQQSIYSGRSVFGKLWARWKWLRSLRRTKT